MIKTKKREITVIAILLILQTLVYFLCGALKSYIHMDEAYSLGLASYDKVEIQHNEDFYNIWHNGDYYEDYIALEENEFGRYGQVYENQKNDVHPPLYYLILRFAMGFAPGGYTIWPGVIINMVFYALITLLSYAVFQRLLKEETHSKEKSALFAFLGSVTMAALTNVLYIRMYALTALFISLVTYLHIKLRECSSHKAKWLVFISLSALLGSLTHYYFLFYLFALFVYQSYRYIKTKDYKSLWLYIIAIAVAAALSLLIFPYSIQHMFFGYQGEGFISRLFNVKQFANNLTSYFWTINEYGFNNTLPVLTLGAIVLCIYRKRRHRDVKPIKEQDKEKIITLNSMLIPTLFYFFLVSIASPWIELRYVAAICINAFALVFYYFCRLLKSIWDVKTASKIICAVLVLMFVLLPVIFRQEPQSMYYKSRGDIVERIETNSDVPAIYAFNSSHNRFLDDILLFAKLDRSYIAKDVECTAENYKSILQGEDLSKGLFVFINAGYQNDDVVDAIVEAGEFKSFQWIKRLNACDVYYIEPSLP